MRSRIAFKLSIVWLAVAVPLVFILVVSLVTRYEARIDVIKQERIGYARLSEFAFDSLIDSAQRTMSALGARSSELTQSPSVTAERLARVAALYPATYVVFAGTDGTGLVGSSEEIVGQDFSRLIAFRSALNDPSGVAIEPSSRIGGTIPGFHVAQVVYDAMNRPVGVMLMRIDVNRLHMEFPLQVPTGGISIVDSRGQVVFQSDDPGYALARDQWGDRFWVVRSALNGRVASTRDFFPGGTRRLAAFVPVSRYGWAAGSSVAYAPALSEFWGSAVVILPVSLAVAAIGLLISILVAGPIRKDLHRLADQAEFIGKGDFEKPVTVKRNDEIGVVADALEHARLGLQRYEEENLLLFEQQEEVAELNSALSDVSAVVHSTLAFQEVLDRVLERAAIALGCEAASVHMRDENGWTRVAQYGLPKELEGEWLSDEQDSIATQVFANREPIIVADAPNDPRIDRWFTERYGLKSAMVFPLISRGQVFGVLFFDYLSMPWEFSDAEIDFGSKLSSQISLAWQNARLFEAEHDVAEKLQSALLALPESIEGIEYGVHYSSATDTARVGGDFYDLFEMGDTRVGITIGDMSGHGLDAAVLTSLVKTAIRVRAAEGGVSPAQVLVTANQVLYADSGSEGFATVVFAVLDTADGSLCYSSGGHTTGAIVSRQGVRPMPANSPLVGAMPSFQFDTSKAYLAEGELLFLYTDGLIEARKGRELFGEQRLFELLTALYDMEPEGLAQRVFSEVFSFARGQLSDDIAILVLRRSARKPNGA